MEEEDDLLAVHGTRVKVYNLFSKFPVRRKYLATRFTSKTEVGREFEKLKHLLTALLLASPYPFDLDVRYADPHLKSGYKQSRSSIDASDSQRTYRDLETVCSVLYQFGHIDQPKTAGWQEVSVSSQGVSLRAALCSIPSPHKLVQFISVNQFPLNKLAQPELFELVNASFDVSTFGVPRSDVTSGAETVADGEAKFLQAGHVPGYRKGVDRWPMFVIWIDTDREYFSASYNTLGNIQKVLSRCSTLLETLISEYLTSHQWSVPPRGKQDTQLFLVTGSPVRTSSANTRFESPHERETYVSVKSGSIVAAPGTLAEMPFHDSDRNDWQKASEISASQERSSLAASKLSYRFRSHASSTIGKATIWRDPQTGKDIHLDPRTGTVLPDLKTSSRHGYSSALCQRRRSSVPISQLAQNAKKYLRGLESNRERSIREISSSEDVCSVSDTMGSSQNRLARRFGDPAATYSFQDNTLQAPRISRAALATLTVLGQVDRKFVLGIVSDGRSASAHKPAKQHHLVLIDQHAADERVKVEQLIRSLHDKVVCLDAPMIFEISLKEASLLESYKSYFERLHISYQVMQHNELSCAEDAAPIPTFRVYVTTLPEAIAERCRQQPQIVIDLLREEIWSEGRSSVASSTGRTKVQERRDVAEDSHGAGHDVPNASALPSRLLNLLNSRACRSAIMFNDELTRHQCSSLVSSLAECVLPFQCAHGRPSMVNLAALSSMKLENPLSGSEIGLHSLRPGASGQLKPDLQHEDLNVIDVARTFGSAYKAWIEGTDGTMESIPLRSFPDPKAKSLSIE